ncbi:MAG: RNA polymerase sigma factor [Nannocystales bacterium]
MTLADLYEAQLDWVIATLRRLGVRDAEVDDAAHELFLVVHRKLHTFDTTRPLRPWLFGIAYRVARDHLRRGSARLRLVESVELEQGVDLESQAGARHQLARVQQALDTLDYERRATFVMYELDGFSVPQISEVLGCPPNTLYSHLRRARKLVHAHLASAEESQHEHG